MRSVFVISLVSAVVSALAVFAFSVIDRVPRPGAEAARTTEMAVAGAFCLVWLIVAFWVWRRQRTGALPDWLRLSLLVTGCLYSFFVVLGVLG